MFIKVLRRYAQVKLDSDGVNDYKHHMNSEIKTERVTILLTPSELKAIDDWSFAQRIRSRGEAIRRLIEFGMETAKQKEQA